MKKIKELYLQYKEVINYLFFGGCTTVVNFITFILCFNILKINDIISQVIAWVVAVIFAYVTNKIWVFESNNHTLDTIIKEITSFFSCRILTGILDVIIMYIFVDKLKFNDIVIKALSNILVIILNYVASKLLIFKDHNKSKKIK